MPSVLGVENSDFFFRRDLVVTKVYSPGLLMEVGRSTSVSSGWNTVLVIAGA